MRAPTSALEFVRLADVGTQITFADSLGNVADFVRKRGGMLTWPFLDGLYATGEGEELRFAAEFGVSLHDARLIDLASRETYSTAVCANLRTNHLNVARHDQIDALLALVLLLFAPKGESDKFLRDVSQYSDGAPED